MPRSRAQSDFSATRGHWIDPCAGGLVAGRGDASRAGARADVAHAGELATRWILRLTVLLRALLAVVCMVGPHIPAGE